MPRPRSNVLKVGDKVSYKKFEGVVVFVSSCDLKPYNVHFVNHKRGLFEFNQLKKVRPQFNLEDIADEDNIDKDFIDAKG